VLISALSVSAFASIASRGSARLGELPNHLPEAAPYNVAEAKKYPPPYDAVFSGKGNPAVCGGCHKEIFAEWNGSMMSNSWRDPGWRAAFFLIARLTATDGNCDTPAPPDGTPRSKLNPFANENCTSTFDIGTAHTTRGSGSLLDGFCSRCHMPANYMDAVSPKNVRTDKNGIEDAILDPGFDPTSARGGEIAYATMEHRSRNTEAGKLGITCTFCHTFTETRHTPFHNYGKSGSEYFDASKVKSRLELPPEQQEMFSPPDPESPTLGYTLGAGSYRVSPQALLGFERFGPLMHAGHKADSDPYVSSAFKTSIAYQKGKFEVAPHRGNYDVFFERAEMCAACHDVTNPMPIKNKLGHWVGGFPIERTYSEWARSRYADRPGNANFDPSHKRDCQTCHMQQDFGQPGTAQTLFWPGGPLPPRPGKLATGAPDRSITFSHHFVGGNTYSTHMIGADATSDGKTQPYPELSVYSFSSADPKSPYHDAVWENVSSHGPDTQHMRFAWDRLMNAVEVEVSTQQSAKPDTESPIRITVVNSGAGHDFPTGFPEGRNAWVAVRAMDVGTGKPLQIADSFWKRRSLAVGNLTDHELVDPNFPKCNWEVPAGAPDPYAYQFRAVASLGDGCPTLALPYATPLNLTLNATGVPIDAENKPIDAKNPLGLPRFKDLDHDGDLYDDAYLVDTRLRPLPNAGATLALDRYSVVIPHDVVGPIAVVGAVYYQSMEAVVAKKFMGNMADLDLDHKLEPCVLGGACDGRTPQREPAVVEGAPPVPVRVQSKIVNVEGHTDTSAPTANVYPTPNHRNAYRDVIPKVTFAEPVKGIDASSFTLEDSTGARVAAHVAQIDDFTWALFPDAVFLERGKTYHARVSDPVCDLNDNCVHRNLSWEFSVAPVDDYATGDTRSPARPLSVALATSAGFIGPDLARVTRAASSPWCWLLVLSAVLVLGGLLLMVWGKATPAVDRAPNRVA
jgi:hypothetical protein